jgi:hypothetical protein
MLKLFLVTALWFGLSSSSHAAPPKFVLVSDIDDTLLITNVENKASALLNSFKKSKAFGGMAELLSGYGSDSAVHYVSGSAKFLHSKLQRFIKAFDFPYGPLHLIAVDDWVRHRTQDHKLRTIGGLLEEYKKSAPGTPFLLFGDNTQLDADTYEILRKRYSDQILKVYIHRVSGENPPAKDGISYQTAVDLGYLELQAGRISDATMMDIVRSFLNTAEIDFRRLYPVWSFCPKTLDELPPQIASAFLLTGDGGPFLEERRKVGVMTLMHCIQRFSPNSEPAQNEN